MDSTVSSEENSLYFKDGASIVPASKTIIYMGRLKKLV